jgi:hypothetical protein
MEIKRHQLSSETKAKLQEVVPLPQGPLGYVHLEAMETYLSD